MRDKIEFERIPILFLFQFFPDYPPIPISIEISASMIIPNSQYPLKDSSFFQWLPIQRQNQTMMLWGLLAGGLCGAAGRRRGRRRRQRGALRRPGGRWGRAGHHWRGGSETATGPGENPENWGGDPWFFIVFLR